MRCVAFQFSFVERKKIYIWLFRCRFIYIFLLTIMSLNCLALCNYWRLVDLIFVYNFFFFLVTYWNLFRQWLVLRALICLIAWVVLFLFAGCHCGFMKFHVKFSKERFYFEWRIRGPDLWNNFTEILKFRNFIDQWIFLNETSTSDMALFLWCKDCMQVYSHSISIFTTISELENNSKHDKMLILYSKEIDIEMITKYMFKKIIYVCELWYLEIFILP